MKNNMNRSSNLYRNPSFLKGAARIFDLYGNFDKYTTHSTEDEADISALKRDWDIVGSDLFAAIKKYGKKIQNYAT